MMKMGIDNIEKKNFLDFSSDFFIVKYNRMCSAPIGISITTLLAIIHTFSSGCFFYYRLAVPCAIFKLPSGAAAYYKLSKYFNIR